MNVLQAVPNATAPNFGLLMKWPSNEASSPRSTFCSRSRAPPSTSSTPTDLRSVLRPSTVLPPPPTAAIGVQFVAICGHCVPPRRQEGTKPQVRMPVSSDLPSAFLPAATLPQLLCSETIPAPSAEPSSPLYLNGNTTTNNKAIEDTGKSECFRESESSSTAVVEVPSFAAAHCRHLERLFITAAAGHCGGASNFTVLPPPPPPRPVTPPRERANLNTAQPKSKNLRKSPHRLHHHRIMLNSSRRNQLHSRPQPSCFVIRPHCWTPCALPFSAISRQPNCRRPRLQHKSSNNNSNGNSKIL